MLLQHQCDYIPLKFSKLLLISSSVRIHYCNNGELASFYIDWGDDMVLGYYADNLKHIRAYITFISDGTIPCSHRGQMPSSIWGWSAQEGCCGSFLRPSSMRLRLQSWWKILLPWTMRNIIFSHTRLIPVFWSEIKSLKCVKQTLFPPPAASGRNWYTWEIQRNCGHHHSSPGHQWQRSQILHRLLYRQNSGKLTRRIQRGVSHGEWGFILFKNTCQH